MEGARPATAGDASRVAELAQQARAELRPERGGPLFLDRDAGPAPVPSDAAEGETLDGRRMWVGTFDDVVVGYAVAAVEPVPEGAPLGRLDEVYVEGEARGVGIGEAMMNLVLEWLKSCGCRGVDGYALPGMRDTKNFFETFGFTARLLVVHHRLDG